MSNIGLAVDLGTTTIDMCLVELDTGRRLDETHLMNGQSLYGSDVITRIFNASRNRELLLKMKKAAAEDIAEGLTNMLSLHKIPIAAGALDKICICGNTTMISILLEYELDGLGVYPFKTSLGKSIRCMTYDIFGDGFPVSCELILSGCASAFIGGDILSGMVHLMNKDNEMFDDRHTSIILDFGTNGEMVLCDKGYYIATSTACGPAFEGCMRRQGVYGAPAIDALALGIRTGNISSEGILTKAYFDKGVDIMGVHLDMDIIRKLLPAKAAIYTGISFLLEEAQIASSEVDRVYLAGGFGLYLSLSSAVEIGLLPSDFINKIIVAGNTSLLGACDILMSEHSYKCLEYFTKPGRIKVLQLAGREAYQARLIENMTFEVR